MCNECATTSSPSLRVSGTSRTVQRSVPRLVREAASGDGGWAPIPRGWGGRAEDAVLALHRHVPRHRLDRPHARRRVVVERRWAVRRILLHGLVPLRARREDLARRWAERPRVLRDLVVHAWRRAVLRQRVWNALDALLSAGARAEVRRGSAVLRQHMLRRVAAWPGLGPDGSPGIVPNLGRVRLVEVQRARRRRDGRSRREAGP